MRYLVKNGFKNLWNNRMMTVASVGTLIACLLIVGVAVLFSLNVDNMVEYVGEQNELVVFMEVGTSDAQLTEVESQLNRIDGLSDITYVSSEEAMQSIVTKYLDGDAGLLEGMDDSFMPASFRCRIADPEIASDLIQTLEAMDGVQTVEAPTEITETLVRLRKMINIFGGAIIIALVIVSLVIITNTIRASVFTRRREISIMKYVGATNAFIRIPFIVEGIVLGLLSACIAFGLVWGGYNVFLDIIRLESTSLMASVISQVMPFSELATQVLGCFLLAGVGVGCIGSVFSMRGYLKV
jgi:cell division transport system permease protein